MKFKTNDSELLSEAYEDLVKNRFITEDEDEPKEEKEEKDEPEEKEEKSEGGSEEKEEKSEDKDESKSESPFGPAKSEEKEEGSDESKEGEESEEGSEEGDAGVKGKVEKLQKQYNDILIDAFEKYAPECIEGALSNVKSSFGENIEGILDDALQQLKTKIMADLGIEAGMMGGEGGIGGMDVEMGNDSGIEFGSPVGGVPTISVSGDQSELEDQENPEHEAEESPEEETEERESGEEDEKEEKVEEGIERKTIRDRLRDMASKKDREKGTGGRGGAYQEMGQKKGTGGRGGAYQEMGQKKGKKEDKEESLSECVANFYGYK